ncbi:MAG: hypothetical protein RIC89_11175, partial [Pseudomonadales bacterium]
AIESLLFGQAPSVGKVTNIILHGLNGLLLGMFLFRVISRFDHRNAAILSIGAAAVWLLTPLQVSTVLYQTQRMAILSALFMLLSCMFYVGFRECFVQQREWVSQLILCFLSFLAAMLSKENAFVLLLVIPSLELLLLQPAGVANKREKAIKRLAWRGLFAVLAASAVGLFAIAGWLDSAYEERSFSITERLLTQPRVLWDLVFQFFNPDVSRMGLFHDDFTVSTSLVDPLSTLAALLGWVFVIATAGFAAVKPEGRRVVAGGVIFLFAHSIESSFLPLELYFEHRNYFPSVGLVLILSCSLSCVIRWSKESRAPLLVFAGCYILYLLFATVSQVRVWSQASSIIVNDVAFHPSSPRANMSFAVLLANAGSYPEAIKHLKIAEENDRDLTSTIYRLREASLACLANSPMDSGVLNGFDADEGLASDEAEAAILLIVDRVQVDACPKFQATLLANRLLEGINPESFSERQRFRVFMLGASLENVLERYRQALYYSTLALALQPEHVEALLMNLHFALILGKERVALDARQKLNALEQRGKLNARQREVFFMYRERLDT